VLLALGAAAPLSAQQTQAEKWIEAGHWKRARAVVEKRILEAPDDPHANFLLSQIHGAFGDRTTPLPFAEKAVALDGRTAKYHRQVAEVLGVVAQHSNALQQLLLARRFRKEIDLALKLNPRDVQANRDLLEFYLLAPGIAGGSGREASAVAERIAAIDLAEGFLAKARIAEHSSDIQMTESLLRKAADVEPLSYRAQIAAAEFYLTIPHVNLGAAEAAARRALEIDPGRADAYATLAAVLADHGAWNELDATLAEAARQVPDDRYPEYRAAERLVLHGIDLDRAAQYIRSYLAMEPEGNRPSIADANRLLRRLAPTRTALPQARI
jgi:tetratricopeptide (TPR) repeat protein